MNLAKRYVCVICGLLCWLSVPVTVLAQAERNTDFQEFVKLYAAELRRLDQPPLSVEEWDARKQLLRAKLEQAWGGFPALACPLSPRKVGELHRPGYRVEKLLLQTMPNVWMTANAYVPDEVTPRGCPAVLSVHGHWSGAKQDPVVQARSIGLVRLGFFVLCVDAFGAGERGIDEKLGEYHGEMTGAMLLPIGQPLSGLQVYENMRAVDYLQSRPEVDPMRIGITGASGGGNQSMYAGAFDERFQCVVPTCSVGNFQAYLSAACCMCEVVPGILTMTEEGDVLGLAADRGLMVTSATRDAFQFSVGQAKLSLERTRRIAELISPDGAQAVRHTIIESPHHYNQPMREAMYAWMMEHLGDARGAATMSISEPQIDTEEPELLRCFPQESRPDDYVTIPRYAWSVAKRLRNQQTAERDARELQSLAEGKTLQERQAVLAERRASLLSTLGTPPAVVPLDQRVEIGEQGKATKIDFASEANLYVSLVCDAYQAGQAPAKLAILVDIDQDAMQLLHSPQTQKLREQGYSMVIPELRATGRWALKSDKIGHAVDHNSAEWSLLIGRPLLGQWVHDVRRTLDVLADEFGQLPPETLITANAASAPIALVAAALDQRLQQIHLYDCLTSYASPQPYRGQRLGIMVPGILRDVGDIEQLMALLAPRRCVVEGWVNGAGEKVSADELPHAFSFCREVYRQFAAEGQLRLAAAP